MLWTAVCKHVRSFRWNEYIPRKTSTTETDSRRNKKSGHLKTKDF